MILSSESSLQPRACRLDGPQASRRRPGIGPEPAQRWTEGGPRPGRTRAVRGPNPAQMRTVGQFRDTGPAIFLAKSSRPSTSERSKLVPCPHLNHSPCASFRGIPQTIPTGRYGPTWARSDACELRDIPWSRFAWRCSTRASQSVAVPSDVKRLALRVNGN